MSYSKLVESPGEAIREVLEFCGIRHVPECADISRSRLPVATLSSAAVRNGLHAPASPGWLHYAAQLSDLRGALDRMESPERAKA